MKNVLTKQRKHTLACTYFEYMYGRTVAAMRIGLPRFKI